MTTTTNTGYDLLSVAQVAERAGVQKGTVMRAIRRKKLSASKIGWTWVVSETAFSEWMKSRASVEPAA